MHLRVEGVNRRWLGGLGQRLMPDLWLDSLQRIPLDMLWNLGIRALIVDLDNTVAAWNSLEVGDQTLAWFVRVREKGFKVCISSNNAYSRGEPVARMLQVPLVHMAGKPRRKGFRHAMLLMKSCPGETAVVGDQVFTDVLGGKRMGLFTVLVRPVSRREFITTRVIRYIEKRVMRHWRQPLRG